MAACERFSLAMQVRLPQMCAIPNRLARTPLPTTNAVCPSHPCEQSCETSCMPSLITTAVHPTAHAVPPCEQSWRTIEGLHACTCVSLTQGSLT